MTNTHVNRHEMQKSQRPQSGLGLYGSPLKSPFCECCSYYYLMMTVVILKVSSAIEKKPKKL